MLASSVRGERQPFLCWHQNGVFRSTLKLNQEIFDHVSKRICRGDTSLYGWVTYQMKESYWPTARDKPAAINHEIEHSKWYKNVHKVVLSKTMENAGLTHTTIVGEGLSDRINAIKQQEGEDILLFGSPTATHSLIQQDFIDGYWLFVNPIILGQGIPLFVNVKDRIPLKRLVVTRKFACGVIELNFEVYRKKQRTDKSSY